MCRCFIQQVFLTKELARLELGASVAPAPIHRIADKEGSRKPLFTRSDAYALGPVLSAD